MKPTEYFLLVTSEVDSLRTARLLYERGDSSLSNCRAARRVHRRDERPLLDTRGARLPQGDAQSSS